MFNSTETSQYFIQNGTVEVNSLCWSLFSYSMCLSVQVSNGVFTISLPPDHIVTLTTKTGQQKGSYISPPSKPFPIPYEDSFDGAALTH